MVAWSNLRYESAPPLGSGPPQVPTSHDPLPLSFEDEPEEEGVQAVSPRTTDRPRAATRAIVPRTLSLRPGVSSGGVVPC